MIFVLLFVLSLFLVMDIHSFNRAFDYIVPVYLIVSVLTIILYIRRHRDGEQKEGASEEIKIYTLKKKAKNSVIPPGDWKAKFFGRWEKLTRTGFGDFMQFNGAPSMAIYLAKDAHFGQDILDVDGDGARIQINAFGMPSGEGSPCVIGTSEENAVAVPSKDIQKRPLMAKFWWDENEKMLRGKMVWDNSPLVMEQTRRIDENDVLHFYHQAKNVEKFVSYTATLKRTK